MTGYTRQAEANITAGSTARASDVNAECNALAAAFDGTTGHTHGGGTGEAPKIPLTTGVSGTLPMVNGGLGATTPAAARAALDLEVGVDVQAYDQQLVDIAGLTPTDNGVIIGNGSNFVVESGATLKTSLGLTIGTDIQAYNAQLTDIAGLTPTDNNFIVGNGSNFVTESGATARTSLGATSVGEALFTASSASAGRTTLGATTVGAAVFTATDATAARSAIGAVIGTNVQAYDANYIKSNTTANLTAGYTTTDYSAGTKSSGVFTPSPANGNFQYAVNGGAHTLAPPASSCSMVIQYTNNATAGAITTSGFTKVNGSFTTTNGDDFLCYIARCNGFSHLNIVRMQ
jgi:hypothetical protein